ncbi:TATA box-binding protein-like 1 [Leptopilina heterotoma]|uniref:TATA box-binding protein-like 1 n=1 Tax=Leptopilina heterotoma TaxID=63436 RepID=UPI001CA80F4F|nr:TATA box-binding protein-like 1 [Leptopilina heterotoma]XP_043463633.1 TATA box-binding protein-like 1 [Leptopilina heterotoma]XP_043463634.1 TATA box-binding protein-like 1 [Leptopilina heterotoma]
MATVVQNNGMKPLTNGSVNHVDGVNNLRNELSSTNNDELFQVKLESKEEIDDTVKDQEPDLDIYINNVVCTFSVRCHLNLREIALNGSNVEYRRENGMITMKLRKPKTTASIWSSGKISCTGATSEDEAKKAARRFARSLQKLGFKVRFNNYRVVNVLGSCTMPWNIKITKFSERYRQNAEYEPELHPGVTFKMKDPKATLKIFSTGSVTVTAPNVESVRIAIERIYPLVHEFQNERTEQEMIELKLRKRHLAVQFEKEELIKQENEPMEEEFLSGPDENIDSDSDCI